MIVDDSQDVRRLLREVLAPLTRDIIECATGRDALNRFAEEKPDLTVMDLRLPEMDGLTAIRLLRKAWPSCQVVVLTQCDEPALRQAARDAGARDYVLKDDLHELTERLARFAPRSTQE